MESPRPEGHVDPRFASVADAFAEVLVRSNGTGSALAVWHDGRWVVDLWGGYANVARTRPWRRDSIVMTYSVTKPFAAVCALLLVERGLVDLDAPLQWVWPELRARTTLRQVLAHQSGLVRLGAPQPEEALYDWDLLCGLLAEQEPAWPPGIAHGETALFYGHLLGEVVRRVDGRSLGRFLADEVCGPTGLDFHVGLQEPELARTVDLTGFGTEFFREIDGNPAMRQALGNPPGALDATVVNGERWRRAEVPAVNGHGTARAVARFYKALHAGQVLSPSTVEEMVTEARRGPDRVLGTEARWGLGVAVDDDGWGMGGLGGALGWWSEEGRYAFAFLTGEVADHDRSGLLENEVRGCLGLPPLD